MDFATDIAGAANALRRETHPLDDLPTELPTNSGLCAWWSAADVFPVFVDRTFAPDSILRILYLGGASNLRNRITQDHLRQSGKSTLRRTLAGLLFDTENYRTRLTDRVVLIDDDEIRLTE